MLFVDVKANETNITTAMIYYTKQKKKKRYPTSTFNVLWKINLSKKNVA